MNDCDKVDVFVVGVGFVGLVIVVEMVKKGFFVGFVVLDISFVNNYGVWFDEFKDLGFEYCLFYKYDDVLVWFDDFDFVSGIEFG